MRRLLIALVLPLVVASLLAQTRGQTRGQTTAQRYRTAHKVWLAHRPDGLTWDDGKPEAAAAIDAMWDAVIDAANEYVLAHPLATPKQVERALMAIDPETNPSFGPPLEAKVLRLQPNLYAISVTDNTASTVFVLRPQRDKPQVWRIDRAGNQPKDSHRLLKAWQSSNAAESCDKNQSKGLYRTCGPVSGVIAKLPYETSGTPRFSVDAIYSKDAGALVAKQTSIWRWNDDHAELLWIDTYDFSLDVDDGVHYHDGILSIIEKRFPRTFSSCNGCFEPTTEQRLRIGPASVDDLGERTRIPELDLIDELFWRIAHKLPTNSIADPAVGAKLQSQILNATKDAKADDPSSFYIGMLEDWSVMPQKAESRVCVSVDRLDRLIFTLRTDAPHGAKIVAVAEGSDASGRCPHPAN